jgi:hypothetical protein
METPADHDPAAPLATAERLFQRGDFLGARREAERQLAAAPEAARALLARLAPDPWAARFGLLVLALLALMAGLYVR